MLLAREYLSLEYQAQGYKLLISDEYYKLLVKPIKHRKEVEIVELTLNHECFMVMSKKTLEECLHLLE